MRKLCMSVLVILLIGIATFGFGAIPVSAADLELSPDTGGNAIIVIGTGFTSFAAEIEGKIYWDTDTLLTSFPSRIYAYGQYESPEQYIYGFEAIITVPADAEPGVHTVTAIFDNYDGTSESASAEFTVVDLTGPQGEKGDKGDTGPEGPIGPKGNSGSRGAPGAPGATGPQGASGQSGSKGDIGDQGPMGIQGEQGPAGPANTTGVVLGVVAIVISLATLVIIFLGKTKKWIFS